MKLKISREDVYAAAIKDRPGSMAEKLDALAKAGVNLSFVIARREHGKKGKGVVFVTPIKGPNKIKAARKAGFKKTKSLHSLCVEAADKPGLGATLAMELASAGINLRGCSGAALGKKSVLHFAFDTQADQDKAVRQLRKIASTR